MVFWYSCLYTLYIIYTSSDKSSWAYKSFHWTCLETIWHVITQTISCYSSNHHQSIYPLIHPSIYIHLLIYQPSTNLCPTAGSPVYGDASRFWLRGITLHSVHQAAPLIPVRCWSDTCCWPDKCCCWYDDGLIVVVVVVDVGLIVVVVDVAGLIVVVDVGLIVVMSLISDIHNEQFYLLGNCVLHVPVEVCHHHSSVDVR